MGVELAAVDDDNVLPVCNEVVVADDPILPSDELPKGAADGAACSAGNRPEPTPWATPTHSQTQQRQQLVLLQKKHLPLINSHTFIQSIIQ